MLRPLKQTLHGPLLHDLTPLHHRHPIRHLRHNRQVVRDEQHRQPMLPPQPIQQRQNLRLHCNIQRRRRLIRDQQPWPVHNRHRDQNPLPLPPGKLVRIILRPPLHPRQTCPPKSHLLHRRKNLRPHGSTRLTRMMRPDRLCDLRPHRHHRIQRRHRLLKDHRNLPPTSPPHRRLRKPGQVFPVKIDASRNPRSARQKPQNCQRSSRFPRPRLSHQPQRLARTDMKRNTPYCLVLAERDRQILHIQQRCRVHASNTSGNPAPSHS